MAAVRQQAARVAAGNVRDEAWRAGVLRMAHTHSTAYTAQYVATAAGAVRIYTSATERRDGRRFIWFDAADGAMWCECGERCCEHQGAVVGLLQARGEVQYTASAGYDAAVEHNAPTWRMASGF